MYSGINDTDCLSPMVFVQAPHSDEGALHLHSWVLHQTVSSSQDKPPGQYGSTAAKNAMQTTKQV